MKQTLIASLLSLALLGSANAASIFFGEDLSPGGSVPPAGNSANARADFLSNLSAGVSTEDFESFSLGQTAPLGLSFTGSGGTIGATLSGSGDIDNGGAGRFPTSGSQYWEVSGTFEVTFTDPIAAFGFYGTDIGDFNGQITVDLSNGTTNSYTIDNTINAPNGSLLFWGIIDSANLFSKVTFGNTNAGTDFFGFDDLTIGDVGQIQDPPTGLPEPGTLWLFGAGLIFLGRRLANS